jgi:tRNA(Ile)-lysidine synthase
MLRKINNTVRRNRLIKNGDKILIGVSGGPDSLSLLYILKTLQKENRTTLHIAHIDHGLRKCSVRDAEFVKALGGKLGIPVTCSKINLKSLSARGSIEEIARNARLNFLVTLAKKIKADKVALGHNADDQAETVLMRLLKGTGLQGLSGILPKRNLFGVTFIRPLIGVRRKEIESYLKKIGVRARIDETNFNYIFTRNKIRHKLLPLLEKEYNRNIREVLCNLGECSGTDYDYLYTLSSAQLEGFKRKLRLDSFLRLHPAMQRMILRHNIALIKGDTRRITFKHLKELEDMLLNRPVNSVVNLPRGVAVKKTAKYLQFYLQK